MGYELILAKFAGDLVVYALSGAPAPLGLGWPYWILDTDYESYSSVYSCATFVEGSGLKYEYAWLFTRDPVPSDEAVSYLYPALVPLVTSFVTQILPY